MCRPHGTLGRGTAERACYFGYGTAERACYFGRGTAERACYFGRGTAFALGGCSCCSVPAARRLVVFAFYSNRLGCAGSIAVSLIGTVVLVLLVRGCT